MASKFDALDESSDTVMEGIVRNLRRLTSQTGDITTHAVMHGKNISLKELTGTDATDIINLHNTLKEIIKYIKENK